MTAQSWLEFLHDVPSHLASLILLIVIVVVFIAYLKEGALKNLVFNADASMRGSFIQTLVTLGILICIIYGAFSDRVAVNLNKMETLIIGFYTICFGVWSGKKLLEQKMGAPDSGQTTTTETSTQTSSTRTP